MGADTPLREREWKDLKALDYVLVRYGFGPALQIRPRPGEPYGLAARGSMATGDHRAMEVVIWLVLARSYGIA